MARISICNVLDTRAEPRKFWRFSTGSGSSVSLSSDRAGSCTDPLVRRYGRKSWSALWQPKLNLAWLPLDQVFLRVLQLPKCDFSELLAIVEFQLDRLSPIPATQMVWTVELIPHKGSTPSETQTVLVLIASRHDVEAHLGKLEAGGYLADHLETPFLHQLLATEVKESGIWVYPQIADDKPFCLVAWWYAGTLESLSLINLTTPDRWSAELGEELRKTAWAGELEGWLTSQPRHHLVVASDAADAWRTVLQPLTDRPVEVIRPLDAAELATASARRAAHAEGRANLMPAEFAARYQQRFTDSLWIRGLGAVFVIYLVAVGAYFGWLELMRYEKNGLERQIMALETDYKKVQELKARIAIQKEQIALRYAALDCLRAVSDTLPDGLSLSSLNFSKGTDLSIIGKAAVGKADRVSDFVEGLNSFQIDGKPFFSSTGFPSVRTDPRTGESSWSLSPRLSTSISE